MPRWTTERPPIAARTPEPGKVAGIVAVEMSLDKGNLRVIDQTGARCGLRQAWPIVGKDLDCPARGKHMSARGRGIATDGAAPGAFETKTKVLEGRNNPIAICDPN